MKNIAETETGIQNKATQEIYHCYRCGYETRSKKNLEYHRDNSIDCDNSYKRDLNYGSMITGRR